MSSILNDLDKIRSVDPSNMYNAIFDMPEHLQKAISIGRHWKFNADEFLDIKNVVVIGMGGSAIGGDLVRSLLAARMEVPLTIVRNYELPEYVDDETLVIASSYSGNTEETLAALDDAMNRKSMIAALTTGGMMKDVCELNEIPIAILPEGLQPRAALGYSFAPILIFLERVGLVKDVIPEIESTIAGMKQYRESYIEDIGEDDNPAKLLAKHMHKKIPIIYSGPTLTDTVAVRWKGQICENAKTLAFVNQYAEFNHNELVGWHKQIEPFAKNMIVIQLHDHDDHSQITKRMDIVKTIISELGVTVIDITSLGDTPLERMFYLIQLGDFTSYYLAVLNSVDPTPVEVIQTLKSQLTK